jgi:P-type Cu+ transporter
MAKDPVCGMKITEGHAGAKSEYQGRLYFFCSLDCHHRFEAYPEYYLGLGRLDVREPEHDA